MIGYNTPMFTCQNFKIKGQKDNHESISVDSVSEQNG